MVRKQKEKNEALKLRKDGYSIRQISETLGVSKSSASTWVRDVKISNKGKERLRATRLEGQRKSQVAIAQITKQKAKKAEQYATNVLQNNGDTIESKSLLCAMIYWCEGNKSLADCVFFTNSDPRLIYTFLSLLRSIYALDETKFRVCMHLHAYHRADIQRKFWSKVTKIPEKQFIKPYQKKNTTKRKREGYQGCVQIRYYDVDVARKLMTLAKCYMKKQGPIG